MKQNNNNRYIFAEKINRNQILNNCKKYLLEKENEKNEIRKMKFEEILSKSFNETIVINNDKIKNIIDNCKYIEMLDGQWFDNYGNIHITLCYNDNMKKTEFLTHSEYRKIKSFYHKEIYNENNGILQIFLLKI